MEVYEIDAEGYIIEYYNKEYSADLIKDKRIVEERLPQPLLFLKPKWNGIAWEEGETTEEKAAREEYQRLEALTPTPEEISDAELEIKVITLLMEMGAI